MVLPSPSLAQGDPDEAERNAWAETCTDWDEWDKPGPPFRIAGDDTYYVGTCGISAVLIDTGEGLVLIDSGTETGAKVVMDNIRTLGFALEEVKYLLTSHEHFDHVGGMARIQQATGAKLITSAAAAQVFATGKVSPEDPQFGLIEGVSIANVDRIIGDGETVELGDKRLVAIATPGHTHGAVSWAWEAKSGWDVFIPVVYADSLSPISADEYRFSDQPSYLEEYRSGLERLASHDHCLLVTPHPSASDMRSRLADGHLRMSGPHDCADYAASISARLDARLVEEMEATP
jgi:metallo-beta-lactamase class B